MIIKTDIGVIERNSLSTFVIVNGDYRIGLEAELRGEGLYTKIRWCYDSRTDRRYLAQRYLYKFIRLGVEAGVRLRDLNLLYDFMEVC